MRITAGQYKGRKLETPKNDLIRPTSDKVRQAVFNALNSRGVIQEAIVIDAFCGTGALGIEALSQGAEFCHFFDKNRSSLKLCQQNIATIGIDKASTQCLDVTKVLHKPSDQAPATLIFMDPPYNQNLIPSAIDALQSQGWLSEDAFFMLEMDKREDIAININTLDEKIYSDTKIIFAQNSS